jgi:predicted amidophosphoribosyltransferase
VKMKVLDLVYPPLCLHCKKKLNENLRLVCEECTPFFELLESEGRCPHCFVEQERKGACKECLEKERWYIRVVACIEKRGPVSSFATLLSSGGMPYLAKTAASFMAVQLERISWKPDFLSPLPNPFWRLLWRGKSGERLVAEELSKLLGIPLVRGNRIADTHVLMISVDLNRDQIDKAAKRLFKHYPRKVNALCLVF